MPVIELTFPLLGESLPAQHGYDLYAALCRRVPRLHDADSGWQVAPVAGDAAGNRTLRLDRRRSRLRLRLPTEDIPLALPLAGQKLDVNGFAVRLGVPEVVALEPAATLAAKLVVIKVHGRKLPTPDEFLAAARKQLDARGVACDVAIPLARGGPLAGRPKRGVARVKERRTVGYSLVLRGLSDDGSLALQVRGIGGKRRMGCGWFVPLREGRP